MASRRVRGGPVFLRTPGPGRPLHVRAGHGVAARRDPGVLTAGRTMYIRTPLASRGAARVGVSGAAWRGSPVGDARGVGGGCIRVVPQSGKVYNDLVSGCPGFAVRTALSSSRGCRRRRHSERSERHVRAALQGAAFDRAERERGVRRFALASPGGVCYGLDVRASGSSTGRGTRVCPQSQTSTSPTWSRSQDPQVWVCSPSMYMR